MADSTPGEEAELAVALAASQRGDETHGDRMVAAHNCPPLSVVEDSKTPMEDEGKKKRAKTLMPVPPQLAVFRFEHKSNLVFVQETDKNNKENPSAAQIAKHIACRGDWTALSKDNKKWVATNKSTNHTICWDLVKLQSEQIWQLTFNFGVKKHGLASNCTCRLAMVRHCAMEKVHENNNIINPSVSPQETNTLMRAIHALFASEFKEEFLKSKDSKKRRDFEAANRGNPIKKFHRDVSEFVNDAAKDPTISIVPHSNEDEDQ